jgi:putative hydrolase of the HAD superfamily
MPGSRTAARACWPARCASATSTATWAGASTTTRSPRSPRSRRPAGSNAILSNHVPELPELVGALGIAPYVDAVFTSALTGFEKPHPEAFRYALRAFGDPQHVWMVGDSPTADVQGAEALGLRAILVRGEAVAEAAAVIAAS